MRRTLFGALCLFITLRLSAMEAPALSTAPVLSTATATVAGATSTVSAFQSVCDDLRAVTLVQAEFTEEKTLHILAHPLTSSGTLMFSPTKGVYRVLKEPVHQEMLITHSQLSQMDAHGTVQRMSVRGQKAAQAFVDVFLSFFAGDSRSWEKTFQAEFTGSEDAWTIDLIPRRKSPAAKALRQIVLKGHTGVLDEMTLTEANGDETHTLYTHQQISHSPAAPDLQFPKDLPSP